MKASPRSRPSRTDRRAVTDARRAAMEARKKALLEQAQRRLADRRGPRPPSGKTRRRLLAGAVGVLLLLLLVPDCSEPEPPEPPPPVATPPPSPSSGTPSDSPPAPAAAQSPRTRPAPPPVEAAPLSWRTAFELQVSARAPRLARCFDGASHPGSLRWSASVEPVSGRVSDPTVEPLLGGSSLDRSQRTCVLDVLQSPPYQLDASASRATPTRVALVIEF